MLNIYINTWKNYNEHGCNNGRWITLPMDNQKLMEVLKSVAESMNDSDPEWFVNDYEWEDEDFFEIDETDNYFYLNEISEEINILDEYDKFKLLAVIEAYTSNIREALDTLDDYTFYKNMNMEDVAYEIVSDCYELSEFSLKYFDYAAFAIDLSFDGFYETKFGVIFG